ncbi:hypothetical protein TrVGV298_003631 [Trichoderma virens]|nr:hypothetical protein TrVGV298_003631 [Trichoderma virens]
MLRVLATMTAVPGPFINDAQLQGRYTLQNGTSVPILKRLYGIPGLDDAISQVAITFCQLVFYDDPRMWWQSAVFLTDYAGVTAILMLESLRNANRGTFFQTFAVPLFIAQFVTFGNTAPLYFYFFYVNSPLKKYSTASARLIDGAGVLAILPTMLVVFFIPHLISLFHPDLETRHLANWIWQVYPVWGSILLFTLSSVIRLFLDDKTEAVKRRDMTGIRVVGGLMITLSAMAYWYTLLFSPLSVSEAFIPKYFIELPQDTSTSLLSIFQYDYILSFTSILLWLAYHLGDLKSAGICQLSWARILLSSVVIGCLGGPGVLVWAGWLTREEIMASMEHAKTS